MPAEQIPGDAPDPWALPETYARTQLFAVLMVFERFATLPSPGAIDALQPGFLALLQAFDLVRRAEERREREALAGLL